MKKEKEKAKSTVSASTAAAEPETKESKSGRGKVFTIIGIIMCVILVPILIVNVTMIIKSYTNPDAYPSFAGYNFMIVLSPSMEDTIMTGDLIVVKNADPDAVTGESAAGKEDGTIISFFDPDSNNSSVLTHRCLEVTTDKQGKLAFRTKGDHNNASDPTLCPAENLIGTYVFRIPGAGNIAMWLQTTPGLIVCVAVPIILLVGYDLIMKKRYDKKKKTDTDALLAELETLRAQAAMNDAEKPAPEAAPAAPKAADPAPAEVKTAVEAADDSVDSILSELKSTEAESDQS